MARTFGKIFASQWDDEDFTSLGADAKYVYNFLIPQHDLGHSGIIALRIAPWARRLSKTVAEVDAALRELHARKYVVIDDEEMLLLVRSLIRNDDVYKQPNVFKAAAAQIYACPSKPIRRALLGELERLDETSMRGDTREVCSELIAWLRKGSGNPSPDPSGKGSGDESRQNVQSGQRSRESAGEEGSGNPSGKPLPRARARAGVPHPLPHPLAPSANPSAADAAGSVPPGSPAQLTLVPGFAADEPPKQPEATKPETEGQRVYRLAHTYTDRVKLSNYNAVAGVVKKAVQETTDGGERRYTDRQIEDALTRLRETGWGVSTETMRRALEAPAARLRAASNGHTAFRDDPDRDYSLAAYLRERNGA